MQNQLLIGKILMSVSTIQYGFVPLFVDLNESHVTSPLCVGHPRFHLVSHIILTICISLLGLFLLWVKKIESNSNINITFCLGLFVFGGFFLNLTLMRFYGGTLSDPNGVSPILGIDANLLGFSVSLIVLTIGYWLARSNQVRV